MQTPPNGQHNPYADGAAQFEADRAETHQRTQTRAQKQTPESAPRPVRGFRVLPAYWWALRTIVTGWKLWVPVILLVFVVGFVPFVSILAVPALLCVAVQQTVEPDMGFKDARFPGLGRVAVFTVAFGVIIMMFVGVWLAVSFFAAMIDYSPTGPPPPPRPWYEQPAVYAISIGLVVLLVLVALCTFVLTYAADGRWNTGESLGKGLSAGMKNLDKCVLAIVPLVVAEFQQLAALLSVNPGLSYLDGRVAALCGVLVLAPTCLAVAHGYRQVSGGPVPGEAAHTAAA